MPKTNPGTFAFVDLSVGAHRGRLTPREVGRGVLAVHRNSRRLFRDAVLLLESGRYPTAVATAILAQEESGKFIAIGMIGAADVQTSPLIGLIWPPHRILKRLWKLFTDHEGRNRIMLNAHRRVGQFPPEVREALESRSTASSAETLVVLRERATYADCVQGPERWSLPEAVVDRDTALDMLRGIRKVLGRIPTPAQVAGGFAGHSIPGVTLRPDRLGEFKEWAASPEADELSSVDLKEHQEWKIEVDAVLDRVAAAQP